MVAHSYHWRQSGGTAVAASGPDLVLLSMLQVPIGANPHALAQSRRPMDMMAQGWSTSLFQAEQH
jgi:hypothetical protein